MGRLESFQQFLTSQSVHVPEIGFALNLVLAAGLSFLLGRLYVRCGTALSNRAAFARNFMLLTMTTMLVISIVKSSLALSLGLVGALSIVRFRSAIKEPEELMYLFLALALGLGLGADQWRITVIAFVVVSALILLRARFRARQGQQNLYLTVSSKDLGLDRLAEALRANAAAASLTRFDQNGHGVEASFQVEFEDFAQLNRAREALLGLDPHAGIAFIDSRGVA